MNQVTKKEKSDVALTGMFEEDANTSFSNMAVSYTHLRAHETEADLVCRLLL